ncbi:putative beta-barrel porin [Gillisia mitskevichiae]|uniref:Putative beta-barrel porin n=1 Tax=Gillisia mitskevichiae TaxID=270921 RepID=A0A495PWR3_9FLAO|nr:putative porin [Gillisia mitskevichiae]RKS55047.1 putative beta-barrel porin [Gillisia mitskevichiae]
MKHLSFFLILFLVPLFLLAQEPERDPSVNKRSTQKDSLEKPPITAYKIFSVSGDSTYVDTTLTIQKDYKFNYLRKDNFELVSFANVGQTYNKLAYNFNEIDLIPELGARARHYNFMEVQDIYYYEVPTPLTELFFKTVPEQGQALDAFFTINTSERLNFSIAYKGLRSLGKYQNMLTSTGNFRATLNYATLNKKYRLKTHFVSQDLLNRENGGLTEQALEQYIGKEPGFDDRSILEVKFENAENVLYGKRFFLTHEYDLANGKNNKLTLFHELDFSDKKYVFSQDAPVDFFGDSFKTTNLRDRVKLRNINNVAGVTYANSTLGALKLKAGITHYNYGYNSVFILEDQSVIANRIKGDNYSAGAGYYKNFGPLKMYGDFMVNVAGDLTGHKFLAGADYFINKNNQIKAELRSNESAPNFNFQLYQSDYINYNWQTDFENTNTQSLAVKLESTNLVDVDASYTRITNYTYFSTNEEDLTKPFQESGEISYFKLKAGREFQYGKFALDNTLMYQQVLNGESVLNVPEFTTRNTFYYRDHWFKRALYLQTGLTLKYFTSYQMDGYDPVLAEFYVQNDQSLGGFPVVDFFFNAKVKQTRIFFKLEHLNSLLDANNNFSAPENPYRDFLVRFGLVWDFFL